MTLQLKKVLKMRKHIFHYLAGAAVLTFVTLTTLLYREELLGASLRMGLLKDFHDFNSSSEKSEESHDNPSRAATLPPDPANNIILGIGEAVKSAKDFLQKSVNGVKKSVGGEAEEALPQLHRHIDLHPPHLTLIDIKNLNILINQDICNVEHISLVTIVHSAPRNTEARDIIRKTWGNPKIPGTNTRLVFLFGTVNSSEGQKKLEEESLQYKDIVQADFFDSYRNLSYKNVFGKIWVSRFCEQAEFVVKTDDDMFIDLYATYFITRQYLTHPNYIKNSFLFCPVWTGSKVFRDNSSKWYVSYTEITNDEAPDNVYPNYCTGWIYILNPGTAGRLAEAATRYKMFWIDDVWVTGYLVKYLKMPVINLMEWFEMKVERMLLAKSVQSTNIYHKDYLAAPNERNYEVTFALTRQAEWCYKEKCLNNIYRRNEKVSKEDQLIDNLIEKRLGVRMKAK